MGYAARLMDREDPNRRHAPTPQGLAFLGAVAGGLVHEIRNPLSTMNVTLQLLQEDWEGQPGDERAARTVRRIDSLRGEVNRLESILDDFLRYAGIRRLDLAKSDLNRVLEEVMAFISPECARASVRPGVLSGSQHPAHGARRAAGEAGGAQPAAQRHPGHGGHGGGPEDAPRGRRQLVVRTRLEGDVARVDVIDSGPGIAPAIQDRVWEVYFSARRTGSGLGLPTARRVAEEHGGSLTFETDPGKGTDFILRLPLGGPRS